MLKLDANQWYPVRITFKGREVTVQVNDVVARAAHAVFGQPKTGTSFLVFGESAGFRNVRITKRTPPRDEQSQHRTVPGVANRGKVLFPKAILLLAALFKLSLLAGAYAGANDSVREILALRAAIEDLQATFGPRYAGGKDFLVRLEDVTKAFERGEASAPRQLARLRQEALLANPLLEDLRLLVVKRKPRSAGGPRRRLPPGLDIAMPSNHECNHALDRDGYDDEIAFLSPVRPEGRLTTLYRPPRGSYVGEIDLHWDARRLLFTQSDAENWKIWEIGIDGRGLRQVSRTPSDIDCFDACYLPDGRIVFGSTAPFQAVPCWHGLQTTDRGAVGVRVSNWRGPAALVWRRPGGLRPIRQPGGSPIRLEPARHRRPGAPDARRLAVKRYPL